jgi:hypothetical protein
LGCWYHNQGGKRCYDCHKSGHKCRTLPEHSLPEVRAFLTANAKYLAETMKTPVSLSSHLLKCAPNLYTQTIQRYRAAAKQSIETA